MKKELCERIEKSTVNELVEIIASPSDYVTEVIEYAKEELKKRNVTEDEIESIFVEIDKKKTQEIAESKKTAEAGETILLILSKWFNRKNPQLLISCLLIGIIVLINLPEEIDLFLFIIENNLDWDWGSIEISMPLGILIIGLLGLLWGKKWGWIISVLTLVHFITKIIILGIWEFFIIQRQEDVGIWIDTVLPKSNWPISHIILIILHLTPILLLETKGVINQIRIPKLWSIVIPIIGAIISLMLYGHFLIP